MLKNKINLIVLSLLALGEVLFAAYIFINGYLAQDHSEHMHAAWLIWQGQVPYRDFFEHHNPLLWFILAPLVRLFYHNALILYFSRVLNALVLSGMFWGMYRISKDFLKVSKGAFWLAVMLYFLNKAYLYDLFELAPDSFMYTCFVWGLWWYFKFLGSKQQKNLNISFALFAISFLFLQKILILLLFVGLHVLFLIYKKEIRIKEVAKAAILPIIMVFGLLIYLHYTYSLLLYFLFNYDLNFVMQKFMGAVKISDKVMIAYMTPGLAMLATHAFLKNKNRYRNILVGIVFAEYMAKMLIWAPWVQYFLLMNIVCCIIVMDTLVSLKRKKLAVVAMYVIFLGYLGALMSHRRYELYYYDYYRIHKYIMANTDDDDVIINNSYLFFNLYGKNSSYYWFGYQNIAPVAYYVYGYGEEPDINNMLQKWRPKFFYLNIFVNQLVQENSLKHDYTEYLEKIYDEVPNHGEGAKAFAERWSNKITYPLSATFINENYVETPYFPLVMRKDLSLKVK